MKISCDCPECQLRVIYRQAIHRFDNWKIIGLIFNIKTSGNSWKTSGLIRMSFQPFSREGAKIMEKNTAFCTHEEKIYPHGTEECIAGKCKICSDGDWKERVDVCAPGGAQTRFPE
jgi:hypothetical protein